MRRLGGFPRVCRIVATSIAVLIVVGSNPPADAAPSLQTPRGAASIVIALDKPADRQGYPSNSFVPVSANIASAKKVASAELWADGALVASLQPVGFQNRYGAHFSWQPGTAGEHEVAVRAIDEDGAFADSPAVRIVGTSPVSPRLLVENAANQSLRTIAASLNVPADQLTALNPGIDPDQLLPGGSPVFAPLGTAIGNSRVATPAPAATPAVSPSQRPAPAIARPLSTLKLVDGRLISKPDVEKVYYYVTLGDGNWRRVPEDPNSFVSPMSVDELKGWARSGEPELKDRRAFDVAGKIGNLRSDAAQGGTEFSMEAWGWRGGKLEYLGGFQQLVPVELLPKPDLFLSAGSDLLACGFGTTCPTNDMSIGWRSSDVKVDQDGGSEMVEFLLKTDAKSWSGSSVWQVSTVPFTGGFDPAPPGLVATGTSSYSSFEIDFASLKGQSSAPPAPEPSKTPPGAVTPAQGPELGDELALAKVFNDNLFGASASPLASAQPSMLQAAAKVLNNVTYYVRATPMAGNQPMAAPSNSVEVHRGPKSDGPGIQILDPNEVLPGIFDVQVLDFQTFNPASSGCAKIVRNEGFGYDSGLYQVGKIYCPPVFKGLGGKPWYEQFLDFVASGVDWIAKAYDKVKQGFVTLAAMSIPFCSTSDYCKAALSVGLDLAMVYAGVPPSLPSFAQLEDMGEAALMDYVAQQTGVPCGAGSLCQQGIKAAVAEKKQQALAGGSNEACLPEAEAHAFGFEPMCLPAGVIGVPVEGSMPHPASIKVKVTRKAGSPDVSDEVYARYQLGVGASAVNDNYPAGKPISVPVNYPRDSSTYALMCGMWPDEATVTPSSTLSGMLFGHPNPGSPVSVMPSNLINPVPPELSGPPALPVTVPRLQPGESKEMTIPLSPIQPFWIPGHKEAIQKAGGAVCFDDWYNLYQGSTLRASAEIFCSPQNQWMTCKLDQSAEGKIEMDVPW